MSLHRKKEEIPRTVPHSHHGTGQGNMHGQPGFERRVVRAKARFIKSLSDGFEASQVE